MNDQKLYMDVDMSKRSFEVAIVLDGSSLTIRNKYKASPEGKQEFISSLSKGDVVGLETGNSSFQLAKLIQKKAGCKVHVLNSGKLHLIFKSLKKTDREDALRIAKSIQRTLEEELPTGAIPSDEEMVMRSSATERYRINRTRTQSINALHSLLWNNDIVDYGRNELKHKQSRDKALQKLPELYQTQAKRLITLIDLYEQHLQEIEEEQKVHLKRHPEETTISMSVPGIGPAAAFVLMCYVGNMERFSSSKQVTYFSGYTPKLDISGDQHHYGAITKRGSRQIRQVMNQAAWAAIRSNDGILLRAFYERVRATRGKKKAIVAVARKMLEILYVLHMRKELYQSPLSSDHSRIRNKLRRYGLLFE